MALTNLLIYYFCSIESFRLSCEINSYVFESKDFIFTLSMI